MNRHSLTYMKTPDGRIVRTQSPDSWRDCERLKKAEGESLHRSQCKDKLLAMVKPSQTIYCTLRRVSTSGMQRRISLHTIHNGELVCLDHLASIVTGRKQSDKGGIVCNGCGMDMGFDLVYSIGCALWPTGTPEPHGTRNGAPDYDGGYALRHAWI